MLAGIHLAVALPLIVWQEAADWDSLSDQPTAASTQGWLTETGPNGNAFTFRFNPCQLQWHYLTFQQKIILAGNYPARLLSGWKEPCAPAWTLAGGIEGRAGGTSRQTEVLSSCCLGLLILLQWLLVGSLPVSSFIEGWWGEPAWLITLCTLATSVLLPLQDSPWISQLPMRLSLLAWAFWVLAWPLKSLLRAWRRATAEEPQQADAGTGTKG